VLNPHTGMLQGNIPPKTVGQFTLTITADNGILPSATQQFTLHVTTPPLASLAPGTLRAAQLNAFSARLGAVGGIAPYAWSLVSGSLPAGLSLSSSGVISGTPTTQGTTTVKVKVTDSGTPDTESVTEAVAITVGPPVVTVTTTTSQLPIGAQHRPYSDTLAALGGKRPLTWKVTAGRLPTGLTLDPSTATISGTPAGYGRSVFTVTATDSSTPAVSASANLALTVDVDIQAAVFVTNTGKSALNSFALGANGNAAPLTQINGGATGLDATGGVAIDPVTGDVYVANSQANSITVYSYSANGNAGPLATISGPATQLDNPQGLAIANGDLYVSNIYADTITVYPTGAAGNVTPIAQITGASTDLNEPFALTVAPDGTLWVANYQGDSLTGFAAGANGNVAPVAQIAGAQTGLDGPQGITVDATGDLLAANGRGRIDHRLLPHPARRSDPGDHHHRPRDRPGGPRGRRRRRAGQHLRRQPVCRDRSVRAQRQRQRRAHHQHPRARDRPARTLRAGRRTPAGDRHHPPARRPGPASLQDPAARQPGHDALPLDPPRASPARGASGS
jgi:hypothetical protein